MTERRKCYPEAENYIGIPLLGIWVSIPIEDTRQVSPSLSPEKPEKAPETRRTIGDHLGSLHVD